MARGGRRAGAPGKAYQQRTDLNAHAPLPATAVLGQPYGAAGAQLAAQAAVPMAGTPIPSPTPSPESAPQQLDGPMPGELPPLDAPSARPDEHVMHGAALGPGGGPDMFAPMNPVLHGLSLLNALPNLPPEIRAVQASLNASQANENAP